MIERKPNGIPDNGISTIKLSVTPDRDYSGSNSVHFKVITTSSDELKKLLTSRNFSLIHWKESDGDNTEYNRYRKGENFESASGLIIDFDNTLAIDAAKQRFNQLGLSYYLITSKSHGIKGNRFHVLIPFDQEIKSPEEYRQIVKYVRKKFFPEGDPAVGDLARFFYGSPDDALWYKNNSGQPLNTGTILSVTGWEIQPGYSIKLSDGSEVPITQIDSKVPCYCPHPDHTDNSPSAFVGVNDGKHYVYCSSCNWTWWEIDNTPDWEKICEPYWSYGTDIYDFGIQGDEFFFEKVGEKKFHVLTSTDADRERKRAIYNYLVSNKHIRHITSIDYLGDIEASDSFFDVNKNNGVIGVHHAAIPVDILDNAYIDAYLEDRFGKYMDFIKEWLAMYCYTNHTKLPTIILKGGRGNGKSTFAEIVGEIFRPLTSEWSGSEDSFTYEVEKKLLIVEENENSAPHQYKTLKKYTGQKYATVKKKFKDPYVVRNNMNIILLANDSLPLFVSRDELPSSEFNNQFFVYEMPAINGSLDVGIQTKLEARLGHYIGTELKTVFDSINSTGCRYGIKVPITAEEKALFRDSVSNLESDADKYLQKLALYYGNGRQGTYSGFIEQGFLPTQFFRDFDVSSTHVNIIIKNLKRRGYLIGDTVRVQADGNRQYCYQMTDKLINEIKSADFADVSGCSAQKVAADQ